MSLTRFNFHPPHVSRTQEATGPLPSAATGAGVATSSSAATSPKSVTAERIAKRVSVLLALSVAGQHAGERAAGARPVRAAGARGRCARPAHCPESLCWLVSSVRLSKSTRGSHEQAGSGFNPHAGHQEQITY
eukprot:COSAG02_NODE_264_length_26618_cov_244.096459_15_plen_133_part_00